MRVIKKIILVFLVLGMAAFLILALIPSPVPVSISIVEKGYFAEYTEDEGTTRLRFTRTVSAPINGYLHRVELEPGDTVKAGEMVFSMEPVPVPALDLRALKQARELFEVSRAKYQASQWEYSRAVSRTELAFKERKRHLALFDQGVISRSAMDRVENELEQAAAAEATARAAMEAARYDMENSRAVFEVSSGALAGDDQALVVKAPQSGVILRRERYQEGVVNAGEVIVEIGDLDDLEVQVDLLSVEAVRVRPGMRVILEHWGQKNELSGKVRLVEPAGFKKVSALGVDEQRVPVFVEIISPRQEWNNLGHGYRVEARFILWEADQVTYIPSSSLFRQDDKWKVFVVEDGRAVLRKVETGRRSGLLTQIVHGLTPGEMVITHPGDKVRDGIRVDPDL